MTIKPHHWSKTNLHVVFCVYNYYTTVSSLNNNTVCRLKNFKLQLIHCICLILISYFFFVAAFCYMLLQQNIFNSFLFIILPSSLSFFLLFFNAPHQSPYAPLSQVKNDRRPVGCNQIVCRIKHGLRVGGRL